MLQKGKLVRRAHDHPAVCLETTSYCSTNSRSPRKAPPLSSGGRHRGSGLTFWREGRELYKEGGSRRPSEGVCESMTTDVAVRAQGEITLAYQITAVTGLREELRY